jgi:hypothetical protein
VKPGKQEILDIDDTFCAAHGGQQLAFWNAHQCALSKPEIAEAAIVRGALKTEAS